ncbi:MAG: DUF99 family protein [Thermoproteota archaeon]|nr:DUF99 family protein [Thermoproteota archaeon]
MAVKNFRSIKPEIRVLGVDDAGFIPHSRGTVNVVGVVFRGGYWLDGFMRTRIDVDGLDATEKIASMVRGSPHYKQLRVILLDGVTFGGFNVVDIKELFERLQLPVISVSRERPDFNSIRAALENLPFAEERWRRMENAGELIQIEVRESCKLFLQAAGVSVENAMEIVRRTSTRSCVPEALRVAHIIASGLGIHSSV